MSNKMYVVDAKTPIESDGDSWHVCMFCDEQQAISFARELNRLARILAKCHFTIPTREERDEIERLKELDSGLTFDVYDVHYDCEEVSIQQWDESTLTQ